MVDGDQSTSKMAGRGRGRGRGLLSGNVTAVTPGGGDYQALMIKLSHIRNAEEVKIKEHDNNNTNNTNNGVPTSPPPSSTTSSSSKTTLEDVEGLLSNLQLDIDDSELSNIKQLSGEAAKTGADLKKIAEMIYKKCLGDREFAKSGALVCSQLSNMEVEGMKFRNCILELLQKDFKEKEELKQMSSTRFLGFLATLCQVFCHMRTASGELFKPLVAPICDSMELIMAEDKETSADECEFVLMQLQIIGKELETAGSERLTKLMEKVRTKIVNKDTSPRIRCTLLEVLECYCLRFEELPNDVTRFYCDTMADILAGMVV